MQLQQPPPPFFIVRPHAPAFAVGGSLNVQIDNLLVRVTAVGGAANLCLMFSGYVHFGPRDGGVLTLHVSRLGDQGLPEHPIPPYAMIRQMNPQLMPLPARVHYRFASARRSVGQIIARQVAEGQALVLRDRPGARVEAEDAARAETMIADDGAGMLLLAESWIGELAAGDRLELSIQDYRCYSAVDQPLNIIGESIVVAPAVAAAPPNLADISHVYRHRDVDHALDPAPGTTDYRGDLVSQNGKLKINSDDFLPEETVVLHHNVAGAPQKTLFQLDPYERWALFDSKLAWHVRNWVRAGYIDPPPAVPRRDRREFFARLAQAYGPLYPANHAAALNNYPVGGFAVNPPEPFHHTYVNGEVLGRERPIYFTEVQNLEWHLDRHPLDNFSAAGVRNFIRFDYKGADGVEEYVKRVACSEFAFGQNITGPAGEPSGPRLEREKAGFKAQINAARTYLLAHWLSGTHGLRNPHANNFANINVPAGPAFHVHRVSPLNGRVRNSEDFRLVLEEAWAEVRGQVITHRGRLFPTEYYAGDGAAHQTCPAPREYIEVVRTKYGINCAAAVPGTPYMNAHGHGRGMSQNGSKTLSAAGLTYIQVLHWYYYGVQLRNGYGQGDVLTDPPAAGNWVVAAAPPDLPRPAAQANADRWNTPRAIAAGSDEDWRISHNFLASEFCVNAGGAPTALDVAVRTVRHLQYVRYRIEAQIRIIGVEPHRLLVECGHAMFQVTAEAEFGPLTVTPVPAPPANRWEIALP